MTNKISIECPHCKWVGYHDDLIKNEIAYFCPNCKSIISLHEDCNSIKNGYVDISGDLVIEFPIENEDLEKKYNISRVGEVKISNNRITISNFKVDIANSFIASIKILDYIKEIINNHKSKCLKLFDSQYYFVLRKNIVNKK